MSSSSSECRGLDSSFSNDSLMRPIVDALAQVSSDRSVSFFAEHELRPEDVSINVTGFGDICWPLTREQIRKLETCSKSAKFGRGEETLLDKTVRDTREIEGSKLNVSWKDEALDRALQAMGLQLGVPEQAKLTCHLHNLLIYGPGQFFKAHRDSEKASGMVATLVIVLPSSHIGGELIIEHNKKMHSFVSQNIDYENLKCILFYADCLHKVEIVQSGYRLAMTYNVVLEPAKVLPDQYTNQALEQALKGYFEHSQNVSHEHLKLVYFLDHSYTQHSLNWKYLKCIDFKNAMSFREAAQKLGLSTYLALVEVHELWNATSPDWGWGWGWGRGRGRGSPEPDELIESEWALDYWIDENGETCSNKHFSISEEECCWTKSTNRKSFKVREEYEGNTGNAGNTFDYWYRRAAIVLWRKTDDTVMEFQINYDTALNKLMQHIETPGQENLICATIEKAGPFILDGRTANNFQQFLRLATYIKNEDVAKNLLKKFSNLKPEMAVDIVNLQNLYGIEWCVELFKSWRTCNYRYSIQEDIHILARKLLSAGVAQALIQTIIETELEEAIAKDIRKKESSLQIVFNLLQACCVLPDNALGQKLMNHLMSNSSLYPMHILADLFFMLKECGEANALERYSQIGLFAYQNITELLSKGFRAPDWSIIVNLPCRCEYCIIAERFLHDKSRREMTWPMTLARNRQHVMRAVARCPVSTAEQKRTSLTIIKSTKVCEDSKKHFEKLQKYAANLRMTLMPT